MHPAIESIFKYNLFLEICKQKYDIFSVEESILYINIINLMSAKEFVVPRPNRRFRYS